MEWAMGAEKHVNMACTCQRRRRSKVQRATTQLSVGSEDDFSKYKTDEDDANIGDPILNDVRHDYEDASWSQEFFIHWCNMYCWRPAVRRNTPLVCGLMMPVSASE
jgi:hypothetical protein